MTLTTFENTNFFDDQGRIRTQAKKFHPKTDYRESINLLTDACVEHDFLGISPHNLVAPVALLPVIVVRDGTISHPFIDPQIKYAMGARPRFEACGSIFLMKGDERIHPIVLTVRPTRVTLSFVSEDGERTMRSFHDREPIDSMDNTFVGALCHEVDHLHGRLIVDIARDALLAAFRVLSNPSEEIRELRADWQSIVRAGMPYVLCREPDSGKYIARHGSEYEGSDPPPVSADTLYLTRCFASVDEIWEVSVPRNGTLIPVVPSKTFLALVR